MVHYLGLVKGDRVMGHGLDSITLSKPISLIFVDAYGYNKPTASTFYALGNIGNIFRFPIYFLVKGSHFEALCWNESQFGICQKLHIIVDL